jgi:hypothetical protein
MLQIATGKLFTLPVGWTNELRGILYTSAVLPRETTVTTAAGRLLPSSQHTRPFVLVYELSEHMEKEEQGPGVLVSSGIDPYLRDYAAVVSFALNCVCSPDVDLARRLTSGTRSLTTHEAPDSLVRRFFDKEIWCQDGDLRFLEDFAVRLIGLPRKTFLGVMRALRTYVNAMHRIADDLELAYTLLVASVESLAQDFDQHESDWMSLNQAKRQRIDEVLEEADVDLADRLREAILKGEHLALARRFCEFASAHIPDTYFRERVEGSGLRLGRSDVPEVLRTAYESRSKYVHQLRRLPDAVTLGHVQGEITIGLDGRTAHLTLQGLSRLMRRIIIEFVMRQPFLEREPYHYHPERSGIVRMRLAPEHWVGRVDGDISNQGRLRLEGFLDQLSTGLTNTQGARYTDMRAVIVAAAGFVSQLKKPLRRPYLALHAVFNTYAPNDYKVPLESHIEKLMNRELGEELSSESLLTYTLLEGVPSWPLDAHHKALDGYFRSRPTKSGLRVPRLFEAAMTLDLAERYRNAGDLESCRRCLVIAADNYPGHGGLSAFEKSFDVSVAIRWTGVLLSKGQANVTDAVGESVTSSPNVSTPRRRFTRSMRIYLQLRRRRKLKN